MTNAGYYLPYEADAAANSISEWSDFYLEELYRSRCRAMPDKLTVSLLYILEIT
jgi:hypothetical protein